MNATGEQLELDLSSEPPSEVKSQLSVFIADDAMVGILLPEGVDGVVLEPHIAFRMGATLMGAALAVRDTLADAMERDKSHDN